MYKRQGGQRLDVDRQVFQAQWDGSYAGLWRGPAVLDTAPTTGSVGPTVNWLWLRLLPQSASADAVSYTHLDVYKRQLYAERFNNCAL